ncbi:MAG: pyridoxamine 5'-phosphate oxidase family protein [Lachnospiraceae bacterium]|nr:pyridoxamine 5'-phosphate oxidase family protein [Lachnospiraceae bacterium]
MFRKMRRFRQQLSEEECIAILKKEPRGVLAVLGDEDYPYTVPIDFYYDETDGRIYFHGAKEGHKVDAVRKHDKVSFCVFDEGFRKEGDWALNIKSVVVFGRLHIVEDYDRTIEIARNLGLKYYPDAESVEEEIRKAADRVMCLALTPEHMTGKLVNES